MYIWNKLTLPELQFLQYTPSGSRYAATTDYTVILESQTCCGGPYKITVSFVGFAALKTVMFICSWEKSSELPKINC
jgi:hypothetical protein